MIEFRNALQNRLIDMAKVAIGPGTDSLDYVHTFDNHLHDFNLDFDPNPWPFVVVNVRTAERSGTGEMGIDYDLYEWTVHIYYIDLHADYDVGEKRRDKLVGKLIKAIEENRRLGNLEQVFLGKREYVFDTLISAVTFDSSGQEEEYSFVSEIYLNVYTAKN